MYVYTIYGSYGGKIMSGEISPNQKKNSPRFGPCFSYKAKSRGGLVADQ